MTPAQKAVRPGSRRAGAPARHGHAMALRALQEIHAVLGGKPEAGPVHENAEFYRSVREDVRKLRRLSDLKSQLLSTVSHDLLSPISSVEGFLTMLLAGEAGPLTEKQRHFLDLCDKSLRRITVLIDDLLDHSRLEAGVVKLRPEPVDLEKLLSAAHQDHAVMAGKKKVDLSVSVPKGLPRPSADPHRLRQVLDNLLRNAVKFTPEGGTVLLSARMEKGSVVVSVKDSGIGLSAVEQDRIFDRFYQVERNVSTRARGSGLGLAICKALVERHGGRIWVVSAPGKGSDFQFSLPLSRGSVEGGSRIS